MAILQTWRNKPLSGPANRVRNFSKDELAEYLTFALEMRRRVKEQLRRLNPTEFARTELTFIDKASGEEFSAPCREMACAEMPVAEAPIATGPSTGPPIGQPGEPPAKTAGLEVGEVKQIALTIATALGELHEHGIVHRDLKPENVLCLDDRWKLADFGISKNLSRMMTQKTFQQYGTPGYAAPEQFQGVEARPSADLYSLGKLLVFLLTGQTDIDYVRFSAWRELIARCVRQDPAQRPSIAAVIEELSGLPA
jgi:hypothetical protein